MRVPSRLHSPDCEHENNKPLGRGEDAVVCLDCRVTLTWTLATHDEMLAEESPEK